MTGYVHVYTGDGKGKTTAACGLALRALGNGMRVLLVQFLKSKPTGEVIILESLGNIDIVRADKCRKFFNQMSTEEVQDATQECKQMLAMAQDRAGEYDLIILDEVFGAISNRMIDEGAVKAFLQAKPTHTEVALTGRNAPPGIIEMADYVSEIKCAKHVCDNGIFARPGIEY